MAVLKRVLIVLGILLLIPIVLVAGVFAYATTDSGLATIARLATTYGSSEDMKISIGKIEGSFPTDLTIQGFALADRQGQWLAIDRARFAWSPLQLFSKTLKIDVVDVGRVDLARIPTFPASTEPEPPADPNAPLIPDLPIQIVLDRFALDDLNLGAPVLGVPARLAASASAALREPSQGLAGEFDIRRTDGIAGRVNGRAQFVPSTNGIQLSVRGGEPAGGLIARAAQIPGLPPIDIGLDGAGTFDDLRAQLAVTAGTQGRIDGVVSLAREGRERRIKLALDGDVGRLVPPAYAELAGGAAEIAVEAIVPDSGPIRLIDATVDVPAVQLGARGLVDPTAQTLDLAYDLRAGAAARFASVLPPGVDWVSFSLLGTAKGPIDHPNVRATIDGGGLAAPQGGAETARIMLDVTPNGPLTSETTRVAVLADVTAAGITFADDRLISGVGRSLTVSAALTSDLKGAADVARAEATLANAKVTYTGSVSPAAARGKATVAATDLSTLSALAARELAGAVDLAADVDIAFDLSRLAVTLDGKGSGLKTGVPQADALTGGDVTIVGGVRRATDGSFAFDGLDVRGRHVMLTADGSATAARADVKLRAEVEDLALVDPRAAGRATLAATLTGGFDDLAVKGAFEVADGRALNRPIRGLKVGIDATDVLGDAGGVIGLAGSFDGKPVRGTGRLVTETSGVRRIEGLDIAIASATVNGDVAVTPAGLATGRLAVAAPDLAELGALALLELGGGFAADLALSTPDGVQRVVVKADGDKIVVPGARIGKIDVAATVLDPTGKITIDGTARGSDIAAAGQVVERLAVTAKGAPDGMDVVADVEALKSSVSAAGRVVYAPAETRIDLSRLNLKGGGQTAALTAPARVRLVGTDVLLDSFALKAGEGGLLDVSGRAGAALDLNVGVRELPLALANAFAPDLGVAGMLRGTAKVTGSAAAPAATFDLAIADFAVAQLRAGKVPPLAIATKGRIEGQRVVTDTTITGAGGIRVTAQGSAPLGAGDLDMTVAVRELPLTVANGVSPELGLAGALDADVKVSGPLATPRGTYDARVENFTSAQAKGVPPIQIAASGRLEGRRVTTDTLVTGGGGLRVTARGSAPLGAGDLDMAVGIRAFPLALANAFAPEIGLGGSLAGDAKVRGPIAAPIGTYDLKIVNLTAAQAKGLPALQIATRGTLEGKRVTTDTTITGGGGVRVTAQGSAPLGAGDLDMAVGIRALPLAIVNGFSPGLGLGGSLTGDAKVSGAINAPVGTYDIQIANLTAAQAKGLPALQIATRGTLEGKRVTTDTTITGGGGVRVTAKGSAPLGAGDLDIEVAIRALPLALANGFSPELGLGGSLTGDAKVSGPLTGPIGTYSVKIANLTAIQAKGAPPLQIDARGALEGGRVTTDTVITGGGGIRATAKGSAPLGAGDLDMDVAVRALPLALANGFSPGLGANGTLQADARVSGPVTAPRGTYSVKVSNLSTAATRGAGVPAAQIDARGELQGARATTDTTVTGAGGLRVTARGSAPLGAGDLDIAVAGRAPLAFLNDTLSVSGDRIDGAATFDVRVAGATSSPQINGTARLENASYSNRASGLQLRNIQTVIAASGTNVEVRSLRATTRNGGTISGSGRVAVNPAAGFPGEINFQAQNAEIVGTDIVTAIIDSDLKLQGPLARRPVVNGTIRTRSVEIQIPDKLPAQYTPLPGVRHKGAPGQVTRQMASVNAGQKGGKTEEDGFLATLDIDVQANERIFIRGMGMTAEAGGQIKISGTSANPVPVGAFELREGRGQITVIGQRLTFTRGSVSFAGDLDPTIDFLAGTKAKDVTAQVVITGTASRPKIDFTSQPVLPTDEVLARLLFNKSSGELSPSQALQLAQGLAQYTGIGGGPGALESVRKSLGVDTLDVTAGGEGEGPAVGAGRYISDNIYLGVRTGTTPESSKVTVDIDVSKNVKVQGETGAAGNTAAGVAVEWDY